MSWLRIEKNLSSRDEKRIEESNHSVPIHPAKKSDQSRQELDLKHHCSMAY